MNKQLKEIKTVVSGLTKLPKSKVSFNSSEFLDSMHKIAEEHEEYLKKEYPKYRPSDSFIDGYEYDEAGIERKVEILYRGILDIIEYLNK